MKILVLSSTPWNDNNSFGITFSNFFNGIDDLEFANIYCSSGNPSNNLKMECFQITPGLLIKSRIKKNVPSGIRVENNSKKGTVLSESEEKSVRFAKAYRLQIFFWIRELIWKLGKWKSNELNSFIDEFQPDIIFQPIYPHRYMNRLAQYIKKRTGAPMVAYMSDDDYSFRQLNFSPLYWIDRFWKHGKVCKTINMCEVLYVISDIQKSECQKKFKPKCKILTKSAYFPDREFPGTTNDGLIKILYAGNLGEGRWKSLKLVAQAVERLKGEGFDVQLDTYTPTPQTKAIKKALDKENSCFLHGPIPYKELLNLQKQADILVHVEGLSLKSRLAVHQSFSTKLVDYFEMGKCIFAVGKDDVASINHLIKNDAAIVAQSKDEVYAKTKELLQNKQIILEYNKKAYSCGAKHHERHSMQKNLMSDLENIIKK